MIRTNHRNRQQAERKYTVLRRDAMDLLEPELRETLLINVSLREIDQYALEQAKAWRDMYHAASREAHEPGWSWPRELRRFRQRPRRLELAIWVEDKLCGLALGRISDRSVVATIHLLEGSPVANTNPLAGSVMFIATRFLEVLCIGAGCNQASLEMPVPALINDYKELGYTKEVKRGKRTLRLIKVVHP